MRVPNADHLARPWRIHEMTEGFRLEDTWALPGRGGPDDLPRAVDILTSFDPSHSSSFAIRALFAIRWKLGALFGWDDPGDSAAELPLRPLYSLPCEWAAEVVNKTVHAIMHLGWVPDASGSAYHAEMAVYVKPNGRLGEAYMAAIRPLRHLIVYPAMMRAFGQRWEARRSSTAAR